LRVRVAVGRLQPKLARNAEQHQRAIVHLLEEQAAVRADGSDPVDLFLQPHLQQSTRVLPAFLQDFLFQGTERVHRGSANSHTDFRGTTIWRSLSWRERPVVRPTDCHPAAR
jgi:hypothetical protein